MRIFRKAMEWILRAEIYMLGFRRTTIIGVNIALKQRGYEGALTYSNKDVIMVLYKNRTVSFHRSPKMLVPKWYREDFSFIDYVYERLEPGNWS